jgi:alpha-L-fucosidase
MKSILLPITLVSLFVQAADTPAPLDPVPSALQLAWQRMEYTMFCHFGVNTFTNREWGDGKEDPKIFNPSQLDCRQWAKAAREGGFKLMILTAKHHDGFCLWPSAHTQHSVKNAAWKEGKGDVVKEFVEACRAEGLAVGLYLSPWDRNHPSYGSDAYNDYFKNQLTELLTQYGRIDEVWFDGACGEGPNGKRQVYDWPAYYATIRKLAPQAVIAIMGPDVRWVGNESGVAREGESSVKPLGGQQKDVGVTTPSVWFPAECDVSIRPGWFHHPHEDGKVKTVDHLMDIFYKSVGRNSVLLVNVPPDKRGLFHENDVARLREFRAARDTMYANQPSAGAKATATAQRGAGYPAAAAADGDLSTAWATPDDVTAATLTLEFAGPRPVNVVNIQEDIRLGERVRKYRVEAREGGVWNTIGRGTRIGQRNLLRTRPATADAVRLVIDEGAACPVIAEFSAHFDPAAKAQDGGSGSIAAHKPARASNVHGNSTEFGADKAVDDDPETRWATSDATRDCWLDVDLLKEETVGRLEIHELQSRIAKFELLYSSRAGGVWQKAAAGGKTNGRLKLDFAPVKGRYFRLNILEIDGNLGPSVFEFRVFPAKH